jgi:hypothetical protein
MRYMTLTVLCCLAFGRYAAAMDKPPDSPKIQRSWLSSGLVNDMTEINNRMPGTFAHVAYQRAEAVHSLRLPVAIRRFNVSDDSDVELLADYYYRTRARAEADLQQFLRQLAGGGQFPGQLPAQEQLSAQEQPPAQRQFPGPGQLPNQPQAGPQEAALKAVQADRDAIVALGGKLAERTDTVKNLAALIYASLPGFCLRQWQMLPPASYFTWDRGGNVTYIGPVNNTTYVSSSYVGPDANPYATSLNNHFHVAWPQLPTWFPRQPTCIEVNRVTRPAPVVMPPRGGMNTTQAGTWPGPGNNGLHR